MANLNKVMLIGNLTRDPELRYTPKGTAVAELGLAINRVWNNEQGQRQEETTFVDVTLWSRQAELAQQYLTKGNPVYIEGRLTLDTWDDKATGQKRSKLKVVGENLQFLPTGSKSGGGSPQGSGGGSNYQSRSPQERPQGASPIPQQDFQEEDDIPLLTKAVFIPTCAGPSSTSQLRPSGIDGHNSHPSHISHSIRLGHAPPSTPATPAQLRG